MPYNWLTQLLLSLKYNQLSNQIKYDYDSKLTMNRCAKRSAQARAGTYRQCPHGWVHASSGGGRCLWNKKASPLSSVKGEIVGTRALAGLAC